MDVCFLWGVENFSLGSCLVQSTKWGVQVGRFKTTQGANALNMCNFDCKQKTYNTLKLVLKNLVTPIEKFNKFGTTLIRDRIDGENLEF